MGVERMKKTVEESERVEAARLEVARCLLDGMPQQTRYPYINDTI